ncbi:PepSY-like domain-containing protein [Pontibacter ramchanderi]|uniref:Putative PepSY-like beta-lactamase-inhibitor n=1 Tax=Pontibacter ramchanderi TaxID=1179743 RepID=A0A2N3UDJ9_9BACT|nr:PepSY-like domain-containing protein [Pontibacter ramchanderi]PKV67447.1 putative PepSY-like beta-lactamase-inhibitor [Pontibacter ramchanderi]
MKSTALAFLLLAGTLVSCDDKDDDIKIEDVPATVREALSSAFPNATDVDWEKKGEDYEADFDINRVDYSTLFNASGSLMKHKYDIAETELPEPIRANITQNYAEYKIDDPEVLVQDGDTLYQVELDHTTSTDEKLVFSTDGQKLTHAYWD